MLQPLYTIVDRGETFNDNFKELCRCVCKGGYVILSLAHPDTFILKDSIELADTHYEITNDPYGLRNGNIFKVFKNKQQIIDEFSSDFEDICIGQQNDDYYGMNIQLWLVVARKR